jgi:hypothetical protein
MRLLQSIAMVTILLFSYCANANGGFIELARFTWTQGNSHQYILVQLDSYVSWNTARVYASQFETGKNTYLATFTSSSEWFTIRDAVLEPNRREYDQAWLGATDEESEGQWKWVTGEPFSYSDPATFDNLDNEDYLVVWRFGPNDPLQWNDINDTRNNSNRLLIEAEPSSPVPEPTSMVIALLLATIAGKKRRRLLPP